MFVDDSSVEIYDAYIGYNEAHDDGGGLHARGTSSCEVWSSQFVGNQALSNSSGGGAYLVGESAAFVECTFENNSCGGSGGGISQSYGSLSLVSCVMGGNQTSIGSGGAVHSGDAASLHVSECSFRENSAHGGSCLVVNRCPDANLSNSVFDSNANSDTYSGGVVSVGTSVCDIEFCTFLDNSSALGSAINGSGAGGNLTLGVRDCTLAGNTSLSADQRAAIRVSNSASLTLERTIIAFNHASKAVSAVFGATVSCEACCIYGNEEGDWVDSIAGMESLYDNMEVDPCFCGLLTGDLTLCADSPCLPENNLPSVQIGAHGVGCDVCGSAVEATSWGRIKALHR
jgi:predicted outer membrane repeat protein